MFRIRCTLVLLALSLAITGAVAEKTTPLGVYVSPLPTGADWTPLQQEVFIVAKQHLETIGATVSDKEDEYVLFVDATENEGMIALSLLMGHVVPKEVVELSKKAEVMYAGMPAEKRAAFPTDGKWVREQMSEEFVRQFIMPLGSKLVVVQKKEMQTALRQIVEGLYAKYLRRG